MRVVVWVQAWQQECCGEPFAVRDRVAWTFREHLETSWFTDLVEPEVAARVTHVEEHHGGVPEDAPVVEGVVRTIGAVHSRFVREGQWAPGDVRTVPRVQGPGRDTDLPGLHLTGYVVELEVDGT